MKKVFVPFCFVAMAAFACGASSTTLSELPSTAQVFLKEYFPDFAVSFVENDDDEYEVTLSNNIKIDFDKRGRWKSITANVSLPLEILPVQAREYLEANYPNQIVVEIDREDSGFEVTLQNRLDVHFAQDGSFLRVDSD